MEREQIEEKLAEKVVGGSIVFNGAHTTCGYDTNDQYKVEDYDAVMEYLMANYGKMSEKKLLSNLVAKGLLTAL